MTFQTSSQAHIHVTAAGDLGGPAGVKAFTPPDRDFLSRPMIETQAGGLPTWKARRVQAHIDASLDGMIYNTELARIANLSVSYFGRAFRKTFGESVHGYVLGRRVALAQTLMAQGRQTLADIALACGFSDQAHMTRVFGRTVGVTPHRWRQAHGQLLQ